VAATLYVLATAHLGMGAYAEAAAVARESVRGYHETGNLSGRIDGLTLLGHAQAALGESAKAERTWAVAAGITPPADSRAAAIRSLLDGVVPYAVPEPRTESSVPSVGRVHEERRRLGNQVRRDVD
jgi:hypothetical protein